MLRAFHAPVVFVIATAALIGPIGATTVLADTPIGDRITGDLCGSATPPGWTL